MSIPVKRFEFLDQNTNLPITDFYTAGNTKILNTLISDILGTATQLQGILKNTGLSSITNAINSVLGSGSLQRLTKDITNGIKDISGLDPSSLQSTLSESFSGISGAISSVKQLGTDIQQNIAGVLSTPLNVLNSVNLGNISSIVKGDIGSLSSISNIVNTVSGGNYNLTINNNTGLTNVLTGLCTEASKLGLPNVFSSITNKIQNANVILSSGNALLNTLSGNNHSITDILNNPIINNSIRSINPNISNTLTKAYSTMNSIKGIGSDFNNYVDSINSTDNNWRIIPGTATPSTRNIVANTEFSRDYVNNTRDNNHVNSNSDWTIIPHLNNDQIMSVGIKSNIINMKDQFGKSPYILN